MGDINTPTWESVDEHPLPEWFDNAKLGIFIHWGPYAVPGWAPVGNYAEWYPYGMYQEDSEHREYHEEQWGADMEYLDFAEMWTAENWDPEAWATLFEDIGARYVVLTGEHHDGFPLWKSQYTKYNAAEMGPERDIVGDLCESVRDRDMKFAASYHANLNYYQPGFDGVFGHPDFHATTVEDADPGPEYVDFMNAKHRELIRRYEPDLLWFDVPRADGEQLRAQELITEYYERATEWNKEVAVNDRSAEDAWGHHGDFVTPEYETLDEIQETKWEMCRGIGHSFGYNRAEGPEDHLSGEELVHLLIDVVSKNGNLLINIGPKADGTVPDLQREPLEALGAWLGDHGEAIYGTRPWIVAEDEGTAVDVRYTWRDGLLYAFLLDDPDGAIDLSIGEHVDDAAVSVLSDGTTELLDGDHVGDVFRIEIPTDAIDEYATVVAIAGVPNPRQESRS